VEVLEVDAKLFRKCAKPALLVVFTYKETMLYIEGNTIQYVQYVKSRAAKKIYTLIF
jgi:hypothetical protein